MTTLIVSGSFRAGSLNTALAESAASAVEALGGSATLVTDLHRLPFYDPGLDAAGAPAAVEALRVAVAEAAGLIVVTPEYNGGIPGVLGNALDWLSRPMGSSVLRDKPVLVMSASPGQRGGVRGAAHLCSVLGSTGSHPVEGPAIGLAADRLAGGMPDQDLRRQLMAAISAFLTRTPQQAAA